MVITAALAIGGNIFTIYPGFIDPNTKIQVASDKGLVVELVVSCKPGEGIMSFSKVDKLFCIPDSSCHHRFSIAYHKLCNGSD